MAVHTPVSQEQIKLLLCQYSLGELKTFLPILEGVENTNYALKTEAGDFILTLYEKRVRVEDLPFFINLMGHLAQKNINCPMPVPQKDGHYIARIANRSAAIVSKLPGDWLREPKVAHCQQVGRILALMHKAGQDFTMQRRNTLSLPAWQELWKNLRGHFSPEENFKLRHIEAVLENLEKFWPDDLPKGVIHADLFQDNVLFTDSLLTGVIDFYFACCDLLAYDVAITLTAWCFDHDCRYNFAKGAALLKGYQEVRAFTSKEKENFLLLAQGASLRFYLTRLYDWFHTSARSKVQKKNPEEYWLRLQFFAGLQKFEQLGL